MKGATVMDNPGTVPELVSIHAPVKGATELQASADARREVSIHAPVKGATMGNAVTRADTMRFQSTPP